MAKTTNNGLYVGMGGITYLANKAGLIGVMTSGRMDKLIGDEAHLIAHAANMLAQSEGAYFGSRTKIQRIAVHGYAYTGNFAAMRDNAYRDTLHRAI